MSANPVAGTPLDVQTLMDWEGKTRDYVIALANSRSSRLISVNDIYDAICKGTILAPPKVEGRRSGQIMCNVFRNSSSFRQTDQMVASSNPFNKGRKIYVWEYVPHQDEEMTKSTRSKVFFMNLRKW